MLLHGTRNHPCYAANMQISVCGDESSGKTLQAALWFSVVLRLACTDVLLHPPVSGRMQPNTVQIGSNLRQTADFVLLAGAAHSRDATTSSTVVCCAGCRACYICCNRRLSAVCCNVRSDSIPALQELGHTIHRLACLMEGSHVERV
jgi:hypothetical protein